MGYDHTAMIGGRVLLRILTKTNEFKNEIDGKLIERKILTDYVRMQ